MRFPTLVLVWCGVSMPALLVAACGGDDEPVNPKSGAGVGGSTVSSSSDVSTGPGGGVQDAGPDVDNGMPSDVYPAPHPAPPTVVNLGGPVLKAPKVVPVFFSNDDPTMVANLIDFGTKIGATDYWKANTQEYGVGPATAQPAIQLTETATGTVSDADIQDWLAGKLNADDPAFPIPDDDTVFALYYPSGLTIDDGQGLSCQTFGGYHNNTTLDAAHGTQDIAYAVIPRCANFNGLIGIDAVTAAASHELIEASTDPLPQTAPAYGQVDTNHLYWVFALGGGETADMCAQSLGSFTQFPELDYVVQRSWSNKSAKASHDPCVPNIMGQPYFNSAPMFNDSLMLGMGLTVKGVKIALGETKTVDIAMFSDAKTDGPWTVKAIDFGEAQGQSPTLDFSFDRTEGVNGEKLHLDITVLRQTQFDAELFYLVSELGGQKNIWVGIVGN